jgi:hypothetical protein
MQSQKRKQNDVQQIPGDSRYYVKSSSRRGVVHIVDLSNEAKKYQERCTCEGYQLKGVKVCQHIRKAKAFMSGLRETGAISGEPTGMGV